MKQEQSRGHYSAHEPTPDPLEEAIIKAAMAVAEARIELLKATGELRRPTEITNSDELDDHFDELARIYKATFLEVGLPWPPPPIDADYSA
jgi:hypothetical protein